MKALGFVRFPLLHFISFIRSLGGHQRAESARAGGTFYLLGSFMSKAGKNSANIISRAQCDMLANRIPGDQSAIFPGKSTASTLQKSPISFHLPSAAYELSTTPLRPATQTASCPTRTGSQPPVGWNAPVSSLALRTATPVMWTTLKISPHQRSSVSGGGLHPAKAAFIIHAPLITATNNTLVYWFRASEARVSASIQWPPPSEIADTAWSPAHALTF
ncbi:hypothetical protein BJ322DRAFT_1017810 [Thelephora terrestris]|uniref:Uncharacterized protein n=1 Tax=Thelephora terrestris TaxID=56493 RepID=A0A9P6HNE2_9AGAM|nr:hypothetical protein BJ322DRAFT_1017810 [Thelephora terrestris]